MQTRKIPVTVVTGFLGSGKTTLMRHILQNAKGLRIAVIVNEFGELGIDGEILKGCNIGCEDESVTDQPNLYELSNGCLCCTVQEEFYPVMEQLVERREQIDHVLIETSGLALPKPLVQAFNWPSIKNAFTVDAVVTVVDGPAAASGQFAANPQAVDAQRRADPNLDHESPLHELFEDQLASADLVILNKTDLAAPLGVSVPTITEWIGILETTGQIVLVPPYFENFGKRLIKSPKVYLTDSGIACHLLGIDSAHTLSRSPFSGAIFEGFVASEIVKQQSNLGRRRELYFFRDQRGLEVDFIVPTSAQELVLIEAKASRTVRPDAARSVLSLAQSISNHQTRCIVVHATTAEDKDDTVLALGARAMSVAGLLHSLRRGLK